MKKHIQGQVSNMSHIFCCLKKKKIYQSVEKEKRKKKKVVTTLLTLERLKKTFSLSRLKKTGFVGITITVMAYSVIH